MAETRISDFYDVRCELGKIQKLSGVILPIYSIPTDVRTLRDFQDAGMVKLSRGMVTILDQENLESLSISRVIQRRKKGDPE